MELDLSRIEGFDWDAGNAVKNAAKHGVSPQEIERVFFNQPLFVAPDIGHSADEFRYHAFGQSLAGRKLQVAFTLRGDGTRIRAISARDMSRSERARYETQEG